MSECVESKADRMLAKLVGYPLSLHNIEGLYGPNAVQQTEETIALRSGLELAELLQCIRLKAADLGLEINVSLLPLIPNDPDFHRPAFMYDSTEYLPPRDTDVPDFDAESPAESRSIYNAVSILIARRSPLHPSIILEGGVGQMKRADDMLTKIEKMLLENPEAESIDIDLFSVDELSLADVIGYIKKLAPEKIGYELQVDSFLPIAESEERVKARVRFKLIPVPVYLSLD